MAGTRSLFDEMHWHTGGIITESDPLYKSIQQGKRAIHEADRTVVYCYARFQKMTDWAPPPSYWSGRGEAWNSVELVAERLESCL